MNKTFSVLSWVLVAVGALVILLSSVLDWLFPSFLSYLFPRPRMMFRGDEGRWPRAIWTALVPIAMILIGLVMVLIDYRLSRRKTKGKTGDH